MVMTELKVMLKKLISNYRI